MSDSSRDAVNDPVRLVIIAKLRAAGCVFAAEETELLMAQAADPAELEAMVGRRAAGDPLEQILGWAEFCGQRILVEPGVFVPRRRTESLVRQAAKLIAKASEPRPVVVDMCCGSGAVGAALLATSGDIELYAADLHRAAVDCARRNLASRGEVFEGDLFEPLPERLRTRVDVIVCNAPYVPTDEIRLMPPEAREHEPHLTLDGGPDGVEVHRRVAAGAPDWLRPGGHLLIETSKRQAAATIEAMTTNGFTTRVETDDDLNATVAIGRYG